MAIVAGRDLVFMIAYGLSCHFILLPVMAVDIVAATGIRFIWKDLILIVLLGLVYFVINLIDTKATGDPVYPSITWDNW
jgi:hypothetical protein